MSFVQSRKLKNSILFLYIFHSKISFCTILPFSYILIVHLFVQTSLTISIGNSIEFDFTGIFTSITHQIFCIFSLNTANTL